MKKKGKILVTMHKWPHFDEVLAYFLVFLSGFFSKISVFFLDFHTQDNSLTNMDSVLPIGIGQTKFDEHRSLDSSDRIPNECAATLVAKGLEISLNETLKRMIQYSLFHDQKGISMGPFELSLLINALNKFFKDSHKTLELGKEICEALYQRGMHDPTQQDRDELAILIDHFVAQRDQKISFSIQKFSKGIRNGNKIDFDLTEIYIALRDIKGLERAQEITKILLEAKYHIQELFHQALRELNPVKETENFFELKDGKVEFLKNGIKMLTIKSTNTEISKAARYRGADVIIHKNGDDVFISSNKKTVDLTGIIDNIVAALRLEEQYCAAGHLITTDDPAILYRPGDIELFPDPWYFQTEDRGGKAIAKKEQKTQVPLSRITQIAKTILLLGINFKWKAWKRKTGNEHRARQNRV